MLKIIFNAACLISVFLLACNESAAQIRAKELLELNKMCRESVDSRNQKKEEESKGVWSFFAVYLMRSAYSVNEQRCVALVSEYTLFSEKPKSEQRSVLLIDPISNEIRARYDINVDPRKSPIEKESYRIQRGANLGKGFDGMAVVTKVEFESFVSDKTR